MERGLGDRNSRGDSHRGREETCSGLGNQWNILEMMRLQETQDTDARKTQGDAGEHRRMQGDVGHRSDKMKTQDAG